MNPCFPDETRGPPCCCVKAAADAGEELDEDSTYYCTPHWVKNSILLCGKKKSMFPFQCFIGPHWLISVSTYGQIIFFSLLFIFLITENLPTGFTIAAVLLMLSVILSMAHTASSDPGIIYKTTSNEILSQPAVSAAQTEEGNAMGASVLMECSHCQLMRPSTARHCHMCGVCVNKVR